MAVPAHQAVYLQDAPPGRRDLPRPVLPGPPSRYLRQCPAPAGIGRPNLPRLA